MGSLQLSLLLAGIICGAGLTVIMAFSRADEAIDPDFEDY